MIRIFAGPNWGGSSSSGSSMQLNIQVFDPVGGNSTSLSVQLFGCLTREQIRQQVYNAVYNQVVNGWSITLATTDVIEIFGL